MAKISFEKVTLELADQLPPRFKDIMTERFGLEGKDPATLEAVGSRHDITRERVRQIVEEGLRLLGEYLQSSRMKGEVGSAFEYATDTLREAGSLKREDLLLELLKARDEANHAIFLLTLGDQFYNQRETQEFHPFWSLKEDMVENARPLHEDLVRFFEKQKEALTSQELLRSRGKQVLPYLEVSKAIMQGHDGRWGLKSWPQVNPRGMRDKAYLVLKEQKKPLHFREISDLIARLQEKLSAMKKKSVLPQTVHNELIKDPRFVLAGRGTYGLAEWGLAAGTVKDVMRAILEGNGSAMSREELIREIMEKRQVKVSTILLNLQDKSMFSRNPNGTYTLRN